MIRDANNFIMVRKAAENRLKTIGYRYDSFTNYVLYNSHPNSLALSRQMESEILRHKTMLPELLTNCDHNERLDLQPTLKEISEMRYCGANYLLNHIPEVCDILTPPVSKYVNYTMGSSVDVLISERYNKNTYLRNYIIRRYK